MFSNKLIDELGLLRLVPKNTTSTVTVSTETKAESSKPQLPKDEFRLLVKMLHAIGHECQFDLIDFDGESVQYQLPNRKLSFKDINVPDDTQTLNLAGLTEIINNPELKRPVWEKLKTLIS